MSAKVTAVSRTCSRRKMSPDLPQDPRAVANAVLRVADREGQTLTHLSLQKIVYFLHGRYLVERNVALVTGFFEAWKYGPVHPVLFSALKETRGRPIQGLLRQVDPFTQCLGNAYEISDTRIHAYVETYAPSLTRLSAGLLVDLSHARGSPWDVATSLGVPSRAYGDRMHNDLIRNRFVAHKRDLSKVNAYEEPLDECPPT